MAYEDLFVVQQRWVFLACFTELSADYQGCCREPTSQQSPARHVASACVCQLLMSDFELPACQVQVGKFTHTAVKCYVKTTGKRNRQHQIYLQLGNVALAAYEQNVPISQTLCSCLWQNQPFIGTWLASFEYSPHLISGCLNTTNAVYLDQVTNKPERDVGNDDNLSNSLSALNDGAMRKCLHQPRNSLAKLPGRKAKTKKSNWTIS